MNLLRISILAALVLLLGCAEDDAKPTTASTGGSSGSGGSGAATAGAGGSAGGGMNCDVGGAHIEVTLDPNPIDHGLAPEWDTIGVITKSAKNELTVDTCAPNSGCSPSFTKVSIQAPGLEVLFPLGAFVRLHVATSTY